MFSSIIDPISQQWQALSENDKKASVALSIVLGLSIFIFLIILPLISTRADLIQKLSNAESVNFELKILAPKAIGTNKAVSSKSSDSLNSEIRRQGARYGISFQKLEPDGENLKVWLEDARYPSVIQWLGALETLNILHMDLTMENERKAGFVSLRVTFEIR